MWSDCSTWIRTWSARRRTVPHGEFLEILPLADIASCVSANEVGIGVIATPAEAAQDVADRLVSAGVSSILNLSAVHLDVPSSVVVRPVDLATEIQILAVHAAGRGRS